VISALPTSKVAVEMPLSGAISSETRTLPEFVPTSTRRNEPFGSGRPALRRYSRTAEAISAPEKTIWRISEGTEESPKVRQYETG